MTQIGQSVQIFLPIEDGGNQITAGIISYLDGGTNTEIRVFPVDGSKSYVLKKVRHYDFKKEGEPFWLELLDLD